MSDPTTLRDALEAAVPAEPSSPDPSPSPAAPAAPVPEPASAPAADPEPLPLAAEGDAAPARARDATGKFAKTEEGAAKPSQEPAQAIQPGPKAEPRPAVQDRAPASWRPDVREHWAQLPPAVRAEVARRESEVQRTLQETAEARRFTDQLQSVIRPYEAFIKAENSNPLQAIDNLMATAARLRTGTAPELASMVAGIVKQFGVGRFGQQFIEQLDQALVGEIPKADAVQSQVQQVLQQQLAPVQQFMSQFQQQQQAAAQRAQQEAAAEVQSFISQAEFGEDVREEMADLMEIAERRGRQLTLQDAYRQACLANPRVRSVLEGRARAQGAQQVTGAAQRAKAAAVQVTGGPAPGPKADPTDVRSAIEAAIAQSTR